MASEKWAVAVFLLQVCCTVCGFCCKVLMWPCDMSHWLNLKTILEELVERRNEVADLKFPNIIMDQSKHSALHFEHIIVTFGNETDENLLSDFVSIAVNFFPKFSFW